MKKQILSFISRNWFKLGILILLTILIIELQGISYKTIDTTESRYWEETYYQARFCDEYSSSNSVKSLRCLNF